MNPFTEADAARLNNLIDIEMGMDESVDRLDDLIAQCLDDVLDDASAAELEQMLQQEEARQRYVQYARLHAELFAYFKPAREGSSAGTASSSHTTLPLAAMIGMPIDSAGPAAS
ncbi:hypothetical protein [Botrimarina hoheduenensis]|uniref:Uncharacterized protein n=1 Tax=Botrimarina hoheduenensis TaxID=2528000 RepID=A0A5C5WEY2_9BACT|nr:hypothetical protein [Botrimarina hoheduenensis]TWT48641.1 hypothetical protein Pla111_04160 [Botrimarina hoheduenensis]